VTTFTLRLLKRPGARPQAKAGKCHAGTLITAPGILPENDGQPEYRIKHFSEDYERVAQDGELSRA
jgi:hypothetical protein